MSKRTPPRETRRYRRGDYGSPGRKVEPGVPAVLPPLPPGATADRLGLARWIVDKRNPLTARVAMNRLWQQVFGRGLVNTPEDFGTRGDRPTHPELLDWLAVEFMERDWDLKAMHRLMVDSAAFRRSSNATPDQLAADPENTMLARGPRYRLDAEIIRDAALSAGGLLNTKIGGPSVYPPQPDGVTELAYGEPGWPTSSGPDRYRRGLYTYTKRTAPYSSAATLDAPSADEACVQRRRTNTPLQALTLLNDRVYVEAAQAMARRVLQHKSDSEGRITFAYLLAVGRPPDTFESESIIDFYDESLLRFRDETARAWAVSGPIGLFEADRIAELAAWTTVSRAILNLDEVVMQR